MSADTEHFSRNNYWIMRHGQSEANVAGIIVSDPQKGVSKYGLSELGVSQVKASTMSSALKGKSVHIYSSDFLRAQQTAQLALEVLNPLATLTYSPLLRERYFGELDGGDDSQYQRVWSHDALDANHKYYGVESVNGVAERIRRLINSLEQKHTNDTILLVAHGDVLQIMQTVFEQRPTSEHRLVKHLDVAEIRQLR